MFLYILISWKVKEAFLIYEKTLTNKIKRLKYGDSKISNENKIVTEKSHKAATDSYDYPFVETRNNIKIFLLQNK